MLLCEPRLVRLEDFLSVFLELRGDFDLCLSSGDRAREIGCPCYPGGFFLRARLGLRLGDFEL